MFNSPCRVEDGDVTILDEENFRAEVAPPERRRDKSVSKPPPYPCERESSGQEAGRHLRWREIAVVRDHEPHEADCNGDDGGRSCGISAETRRFLNGWQRFFALSVCELEIGARSQTVGCVR